MQGGPRILILLLLLFSLCPDAISSDETQHIPPLPTTPLPVTISELPPDEEESEPVDITAGENYDVNLYFEDDYPRISLDGADRAYTAGWRLSFVEASEDLPNFMPAFLNWFADKDSKFNLGFALGQQIYTPSDLSQSSLITTDQPYAGYLFIGTSLQIRNYGVLHSFELDLGITGPPSLAGPVQINFHRIFGFEPVEGWNNQLTTEPTLTLFYQQRRDLLSLETPSGFRIADLVGNAEGAIGNVYDYVGLGAQVRLGYGLTDDFGPTVLTPVGVDRFVDPDTQRSFLEAYFFASLDARWMGRDLFLDGNTFQSGPHISKENWVYDYDFGAAIRFDALTFSWRQIVRSQETTLEIGPHHYAALLVTYGHRF